MKVTWLFSLTALALLLCSCKKESVKLDSSTSYHISEKEPQVFKVFCSKGEINYTYIVNRFLQWDSGLMSNLMAGLPRLDTIRIIDNTKARIYQYGNRDYSYTISGKDIRFVSTDTLYGTNAGDLLTKSWSYQVSIFKPVVYREYIISSTAGNYLFGYAGKYETYAYVQDGKLVVPWYVILIHSGQLNQKILILQNRLQPDFYKTMATTDTVVMREFRMTYEK